MIQVLPEVCVPVQDTGESIEQPNESNGVGDAPPEVESVIDNVVEPGVGEANGYQGLQSQREKLLEKNQELQSKVEKLEKTIQELLTKEVTEYCTCTEI